MIVKKINKIILVNIFYKVMVPPHGNRGPIDYKTSSFNIFFIIVDITKCYLLQVN